MSVLPQHKTDAIYRVRNLDRYDDRDVIITNLIESYDRLMAFGRKHLNDTFHLDGIQSVSARDSILREIISNLLAHRDFSSGYVAKLVIERDRLYPENANLAHGHGPLNINTFEPFSKNPPISKVFREIGLADELGSGMRNTYKFTEMYSGGEPEFREGDIFRITVPVAEDATIIDDEPDDTGNDTINEKDGEINGEINRENEKINGEDEKINRENEKINEKLNLTEIEKQVLSIIRNNPHIKRPGIISITKIERNKLDRTIKALKEKGLIKRVGSKKIGHWSVSSDVDLAARE